MPEYDGSRQSVQDKGADEAGLIALSRHEFQAGTFERSPWQAAAFSSDSEHVAGATAEHKIYAWSLHGGILARFLEFEGEAPLQGALPSYSLTTALLCHPYSSLLRSYAS